VSKEDHQDDVIHRTNITDHQKKFLQLDSEHEGGEIGIRRQDLLLHTNIQDTMNEANDQTHCFTEFRVGANIDCQRSDFSQS
jgi:hypothetical protein